MSDMTAVARPERAAIDAIYSAKMTIEQSLAGIVPVDRFMAMCRQAYLYNPQSLAKCEPWSVARSMVRVAALQLSPDPQVGDVYLIPRWNKHTRTTECTVVTGYQGMLKRIRRNPAVHHVDAAVVYDGDAFSVVKGLAPDLIHVPTMDMAARGKIFASYAIAFFKQGPPLFWVCNRADLDAARARSEQPNGIWRTDEEAMSMKTSCRRLHKLIPVDDIWVAQMHEEEEREREAAPRDVASVPDILTSALADADREPGDDTIDVEHDDGETT